MPTGKKQLAGEKVRAASNVVGESSPARRVFKILPLFADHILKHHLEAYVKETIRISYEVNLPMLKYFKDLSEKQLLELSTPGSRDVLQGLVDGTHGEMLAASIEKWTSNQLEWLEKDDFDADDVTLIAHVRKNGLMKFITRFTTEPAKIIALIEEIDEWQLDNTSQTVKTFFGLLQERNSRNVKQLKESEELYKQAQAVTHIGNYVWELNPQRLVWSDELYRIYELDPKTAIINNEVIAAYNHPDDAAMVIEKTTRSMQTLEPYDFHYRIFLKDGRMKTLHARGEVVVDENRKPIKIFGTAQDVTLQKETERRLEENRLFINKITDAAPAIIASYNIQNGQFVYVSQGLSNLLGYDADWALKQGMSFFAGLVHPDDLPAIAARNTQAEMDANKLAGSPSESVVEFIYRMRHADGTYLWFHTYGTVFSRDSSGKVELVLNISLDISEKVKAEEILIERTAELQQSNASLQEFAFIASHDLKEPLRKISTLGDRLLQTERENYSSTGKVYLDKMIGAALRMQQMVDDLLSLSQISTDTHFENVSLNHLFTDVLQTFESRIESMQVTIKADRLPDAEVVPSQFRQLFQNLLSNSLKFAKKDRPLIISVNCEKLDEADLRNLNVRKAPVYYKLTFGDNGIGFDNRFADKIFAIFQRLHSRSEYEGTGIGLAICKKILENHGGIIQASSIPGEGTEFTVIVPTN